MREYIANPLSKKWDLYYTPKATHSELKFTSESTITKTLWLLGLLVLVATSSFKITYSFPTIGNWLIIGAIAFSLGFYFIAWHTQSLLKFISPLYAISQGVGLGAISALLEDKTHGVVGQAILATIATATTIVVFYQAGVISIKHRFFSIIFGATTGVCFMYSIALVLQWLGHPILFLNHPTPISILLSALMAVLSALHLIFDLQYIDELQAHKAQKDKEWLSAIMVLSTLTWMYLSILKLIRRLLYQR
jgi:uncharacterized YccA/Bax inhibitor family protein